MAFASGPEGAETLEATGSRSLDCHDLVFAVSDGMGGGNAGDLASALLLQRMSEIIPETF
jgi:protein phosphatase